MINNFDCLVSIFSYLSNSSLKNCRNVCYFWRDVVDSSFEIDLTGKLCDNFLSNYKNARRIILSQCDITDFSCLHNVVKLDISYSKIITDEQLSLFTNVYEINLYSCRYITDKGVSCIKKAVVVNIGMCPLITDEGVSLLTEVVTLDVSGCRLITGSSFILLSKLQNLNVSMCTSLNKDNLKNLKLKSIDTSFTF